MGGLSQDEASDTPSPVIVTAIKCSGAMTLLGDAAHTMPPALAQGANQALLDTMVLCKALSDFREATDRGNGDLASALRWYEKTRRRRLTALSWVTSRQISQSQSVLKRAAMISDSFGTWAMTAFLRWLSHRRISAEVDPDLSSRPTRSSTSEAKSA
ncbi:MAG: FAD-dependent oxidoreductase [Mycobacterium sp.]